MYRGELGLIAIQAHWFGIPTGTSPPGNFVADKTFPKYGGRPRVTALDIWLSSDLASVDMIMVYMPIKSIPVNDSRMAQCR